MQRKQQFFPEKQMLPVVDQRDCAYMHNAPISPFFGGTLSPPIENPWTTFRGVSFQPSESCPRNFIICDQTDKQIQIMYHPAITPQLCCTGQNAGFPSLKDAGKTHAVNIEREISSFKEDSDDIDALLSYDEDEEEESDDDEVSSARTQGNYKCDLSVSWSSNSLRSRKGKVPSFSHDSVGGGSNSSGLKRQKMRKMVKTLRKIVPGGNEMNAVAVLDEAVRYLKTLKVEAQKLGLGNLKRKS